MLTPRRQARQGGDRLPFVGSAGFACADAAVAQGDTVRFIITMSSVIPANSYPSFTRPRGQIRLMLVPPARQVTPKAWFHRQIEANIKRI
jgi:hypothetical protein